MKTFFTFKQLLVIATAGVSALLFSILCWCFSHTLPAPIKIEAEGAIVLGKREAPLEIILFEDFLCEGCQVFNREVFPLLKEKYIDTGKAKFILVPLAFLRGSKPLANAVLAVYEIAPDQIFSYMHGITLGFFEKEEEESFIAVEQKLVNLAKIVGDIDLLAFKACVMTGCHEATLEKNLILAKQIMGREFGTPTVYVGGIPCTTSSFEGIQKLAEKL